MSSGFQLRGAPLEAEHRAVPLAELRVAEQHRRGQRGVDPGAETHRVRGEHQVLQQQVGLDLGPHRPQRAERQLEVLVEEAGLDPLLHPGGPVEVPVVDDRRAGAFGLGEEVHQAVDVLPRQLHDGEQDRGARLVRQEPVRVEVRREVPVPSWYVDAVVEQLHLGLGRSRDQGLLVERGSRRRPRGRRQLAQEVRAAVVDQEEVRALRVVRAARGAAEHVEVRLGHDRLAVARVVERPVRHREAGATGQRDQHRLLEVRQRLVRHLRGPAHRSGGHRAAPAHAVRPALPDRGEQRTVVESVETGAPGLLRGHETLPTGATTGRQGANAVPSRGSSPARSGQCRRITLVIPFFSTQSMPNGE